MTNIYTEHLTHLVKMASIPGAKHHAWHRAKQLAEDRSGLWRGIDKELVQLMAASSQQLQKNGG